MQSLVIASKKGLIVVIRLHRFGHTVCVCAEIGLTCTVYMYDVPSCNNLLYHSYRIAGNFCWCIFFV